MSFRVISCSFRLRGDDSTMAKLLATCSADIILLQHVDETFIPTQWQSGNRLPCGVILDRYCAYRCYTSKPGNGVCILVATDTFARDTSLPKCVMPGTQLTDGCSGLLLHLRHLATDFRCCVACVELPQSTHADHLWRMIMDNYKETTLPLLVFGSKDSTVSTSWMAAQQLQLQLLLPKLVLPKDPANYLCMLSPGVSFKECGLRDQAWLHASITLSATPSPPTPTAGVVPAAAAPKPTKPKVQGAATTGAPTTPASGAPKSGTGASGAPNTGAPVARGTPKCGAATSGASPSAPSSGAPKSGAPSSGAPKSGAPSSGAPKSGAPSSGAPKSGAPSGSPSVLKSLASKGKQFLQDMKKALPGSSSGSGTAPPAQHRRSNSARTRPPAKHPKPAARRRANSAGPSRRPLTNPGSDPSSNHPPNKKAATDLQVTGHPTKPPGAKSGTPTGGGFGGAPSHSVGGVGGGAQQPRIVERKPNGIKVMSWNILAHVFTHHQKHIHGGTYLESAVQRSGRHKAIAHAIVKAKADVILLQEVDDTFLPSDWSGGPLPCGVDLRGYTAFRCYSGNSYIQEGVCILLREGWERDPSRPVTRIKANEATGGKNGVTLLARHRDYPAIRCWLSSVHLKWGPNDAPTRQYLLDQALCPTVINSVDPAVLAGDFNTTLLDIEHLETVLKRHPDMKRLPTPPHAATALAGNLAAVPGHVIDYLYTTLDIEKAKCDVGPLNTSGRGPYELDTNTGTIVGDGSDHAWIFAELPLV
eukprot:NODE_456_length_2452_cov_51.215114_g433_i0.p1 GENE.NODE_456_length_2452_cov_51.215114_g433_i0~~NODE_456_length_2452_cov_51.215114_g433_i0.p1  ORF type:complete len:758 (+),score=70.69 NODE_456_length_2452_cov_51.215114_g433_i0:57-2330(+)